MSFKLKSPYVDNTVPVFKVPMEKGVYGKANNDTSSNSGFNIHVNQNINDTPTYLKVVEHENGHINQMSRGDMDYDDQYVYWKGQKIPRANMPEGAHDLPWEKEIYDKSPVNMKLRNGSGNHPAFANLSERGLIKSHAMLAEGDDKKMQGRKVDVKRFDSGMTGYNQRRYVNPGGEVIMKFDPKESTRGGTSQYFIQRQGGQASTEKITREQFRDKLSRGSAKGKFKPFTEKTIGTGGADLKSLELS